MLEPLLNPHDWRHGTASKAAVGAVHIVRGQPCSPSALCRLGWAVFRLVRQKALTIAHFRMSSHSWLCSAAKVGSFGCGLHTEFNWPNSPKQLDTIKGYRNKVLQRECCMLYAETAVNLKWRKGIAQIDHCNHFALHHFQKVVAMAKPAATAIFPKRQFVVLPFLSLASSTCLAGCRACSSR